MTIVVAIDGPAGAGKSTVAKALARKLRVKYLDTGAMYRAVTFLALSDGVSLHDEAAVAELSVNCVLDVGEELVTINSIDATQAIRGPEVTKAVSLVATNSSVRNELRARQRIWVEENGGGVVEGRDIGSVVFPDATLKVYLTASPLVRAKRRVAQSGGDVAQIAAEIAERDRRDSTRSDSPLTKTDDSITVDTSDRSVDEVVAQLEQLVMIADAKRAANR
ncbi:MAG: (d)CMP kinase [Actinobacteria bacterium]|nr:(d)CMP kinase [Actinomycetota bacterium]